MVKLSDLIQKGQPLVVESTFHYLQMVEDGVILGCALGMAYAGLEGIDCVKKAPFVIDQVDLYKALASATGLTKEELLKIDEGHFVDTHNASTIARELKEKGL